MKRWFLGAVLIILVVAFGFLTQGVHKSSLTEDQEQQLAQEAQKEQADKAKDAAAKQPAAPASPAAPVSADTATLPAEEIIGDPATAKHHLEVGWVYEDTDVVNSDRLKAALAEARTFAQKSGGAVSAVIVDLDVPAEDRSPAAQGAANLGVSLDGNSVYAQNPAEAAPGALTAALQGTATP